MTLKAKCHCGAVQFEVTEAPTEVTDCNCSYCGRRGALWAYFRPDQFRLITARDRVATYQWGHYIGENHHCAICGVAAFNEFPNFETGEPDFDDPRISINTRLLEDFDFRALPVTFLNGREF